MAANDLANLAKLLREFAAARDWEQFHSPKNLAMALSVETSEILEHFQWLTEAQSRELSANVRDEVELELADTLIFLVRLADQLDIDLLAAAHRKIEINEEKYPAHVVRGSARKYTDYAPAAQMKTVSDEEDG